MSEQERDEMARAFRRIVGILGKLDLERQQRIVLALEILYRGDDV